MRVLCLALAASVCGCAGSGFGGDPPYRFRHSLIDPEADAAPSPRTQPRTLTPDTARCRRMAGRELRGPRGPLELVRLCTGIALRRVPIDGIAHRDNPEPLELVIFRGEPPILGVVLARSGPRIEFLFLRRGRATVGVLNPVQPHRRRLPGSTRVENSYLRVIQRGDPPSTKYLAGDLLEGFVAPASI